MNQETKILFSLSHKRIRDEVLKILSLGLEVPNFRDDVEIIGETCSLYCEHVSVGRTSVSCVMSPTDFLSNFGFIPDLEIGFSGCITPKNKHIAKFANFIEIAPAQTVKLV